MAILTPSQLVAASNATYFDNTSGSITPASVRSLNTDWVSSSILVSQTGSMSVASASVATSAGSSVSSSYALTASLLLGTIASASYAVTSSLPLGGVVNASAVASTITFVKGDGTTFDVTVSQSGSIATASLSLNSELLDGLDSTSFVFTSSYNVASASLSTRVTNLENWSSSLDNQYATNAELNASSSAIRAGVTSSINVAVSNLQAGVTASIAGFANTASNTFTGTNIFNVVTASFVKALSASIDYLSVVYQTSSVIFSSGSNVFGDNANDTQTLWGTVNMVTGPLNVTGSARLQQLTASGLIYPATDGTLSGQVLQTNAAGTLSFGNVQAIYQTVINGEATSLTVGTAVYVSGSQGANPIVYRADSANASKMPVQYIIPETIASGANGRALLLGVLEGYNVGSTAAGTLFYVDGTGTLTTTRPTGASDIVQPIAVVTKTGAGGQLSVLNPGPVLLPNLQTGYAWVGNGSNQPVAVATSSINNVVSASFATTASFYGGSVVSASFASTASSVNTLNQNVLISGSLTVSQSVIADQVNVVRAGFSSNPFNHQPSSYEGSIRYAADNQNFYITNYNQGTTAEAFTSQSNVGMLLNTGSNFASSYLHTDMSNVSGYLNLENANGNLNLNTNARFTVSASNTMFQAPGGAGVGTWFQNRVLISGPSAGETPKLFISGSDGGYSDLGRGTHVINTTVATGIDATTQMYANPAKEAAQYVGVFTPDTYVDDVEHAIRVNVSGISFNDFDNGSAFDYVPYMTLAPNLGDNPAPVFTRGLGVSGSVNGNVQTVTVTSNTASIDLSTGNFFRVTLANSATTFFNVTNVTPGLTANLVLTTGTVSSASFSSNVKQASGNTYLPTSGSGQIDVLSLMSVDASNIYLVASKKFA